MKQTKLSASSWATIILFGLIGQIAWSIENMQFNLFLFNYIGGTTSDIAAMVAWSAIISTFTTLIMGIVTDRIGKRRLFLCVGYIIWGIITMAFAFISRENTARLFPSRSRIHQQQRQYGTGVVRTEKRRKENSETQQEGI